MEKEIARLQKQFDEEGIELLIPIILDDTSSSSQEDINSTNERLPLNYTNERLPLKDRYKDVLEQLQKYEIHDQSQRSLFLKHEWYQNLGKGVPASNYSQTIERIPGSISQEEFNQRFVSLGKPCIIKDLPKICGWPAVELWNTVENLIESRGEAAIKIFEIPSPTGMGRAYELRLPIELYYQYSLSNQADNPFYGFEYTFEDDPERRKLLGDYFVPHLFKSDFYSSCDMTKLFYPNNRHLIMGGCRTGTNLHYDPKGTCAWNTLLLGKKKWALFPPGTSCEYMKAIGSRTCQSGTAPGGPPSYWWLDHAPNVPPGTGVGGLGSQGG
eukprot:TRINITY_DN7470_c0_g2_i2.p1 TRINITY_DN7470_c0_g2~~TRINITY_DN7470_c0_g2_i2.p1  ORF type:complete len:327 (+),score=50.75 TRINITY_DN7470_c0_g2_i2:352-1332(+)